MNEILEFLILGFLAGIALAIACYPLRKRLHVALVVAPFLLAALVSAYWFWGAGPALHKHLAAQSKQQQIREVLASMNSPDELVQKLKRHLQKEPQNPKGWYILGRVYATQGQWQAAESAFSQALKLKPKDERIIINYAQAIWQNRQQKFDNETRGLFSQVLKVNPKQPDALAMLAMDAFMRHDYQTAIEYWQSLLKLVPPDSRDALSIRKAIAKAQSVE
jgi:cytochrome c-type biogenesis protein CcmH